MVNFNQPCRAHVRQRSHFSEWILPTLSDQGSTVPLLLHYSVAVSVVVVVIDPTHLSQMGRSLTVTGQSVQFSGSGFLLWRWGWFRWRWWFELLLGGPSFTFPFQNLLLVFQIPLVFSLSRHLWIFVGHIEHN